MNFNTEPTVDNKELWTPVPAHIALSFPELFAFHTEKNPTHPIFSYADKQGNVQELLYRDMHPAIRKAAKLIVQEIAGLGCTVGVERPIIGVLVVADSITYTTFAVGAMYAGIAPFLLSVRNSAEALVNLILSSKIHVMFVSSDEGMQRLASEARAILAKDSYDVNLLSFPKFPQFFNLEPVPEDVKLASTDLDQTALIIHSSGSTSFPKPIYIPHKACASYPHMSAYSKPDTINDRMSMHVLPAFHVMSWLGLGMALGCGVVVTVFPPSSVPVVPTPENVMEAMVASKSTRIMIVPSFVESLTRVMFAGAPLNKMVGDQLVKQGVKIVAGYGTTEVGVVAMGTPTSQADGASSNEANLDWEYMRFLEPVKVHRAYVDGASGVFELVLVDSPASPLAKVNTEVDGEPAYATSDLWEEHPSDPRLAKILGRVDDQIILSTGEKTNPVPMETIMNQDPAIQLSVIFGRGRVQNGVIVQPTKPFDPADDATLETFRNTIWPSVERANTFAPSHSRLFKEMIIMARPDKPFQLTAKGTPRRQVCIDEYAEEIEQAYKRVEESSQVDVVPPAVWAQDTTLEYVRTLVHRVMDNSGLKDTDDFFQSGADSLQATWIRNSVLQALRTTTKANVHSIPANFVYLYPTIISLCTYLLRVVSGGVLDATAERTARLDQMRSMLDKYSADFPRPQWNATSTLTKDRRSPLDTVIVTGTTGRLGSHILSLLLARPDVRRVYALNRGPAEDRQRQAWKEWGLDASLLERGKGRLVMCASDTSKVDLGLSEEVFRELRETVTAIIHNGSSQSCFSKVPSDLMHPLPAAWRVDFNVSLPSFEPLIVGTRNLIDLAIASEVPGGPQLLFVSSISALFNHPISNALAVGLGYGESKWRTGLRTTVVRAGQLAGDRSVGGWGVKEWVPAIARLSQLVGSAPAKEDTVAWLPIDTAAAAVINFLDRERPRTDMTRRSSISPLLTLSHGNRRCANGRAPGVPLVPGDVWVEKVRESARTADASGRRESAHELVDFFAVTMGSKEQASLMLSTMEPLGEADVEKWWGTGRESAS
ncbi:acetyl-CoA synthetase-like protein [Epithele typhae]|uniref:acetyl-CoA synthetase-like protein n=1 Tax=Epithele typhae TaxID=378194 RepID=UPI00200869F9|nr:acetyl-CoA synthetase-like protein [Epithele typhae]KAH9935954.1 acetyl-CoA synthetase-like protein [Epithele typhae]